MSRCGDLVVFVTTTRQTDKTNCFSYPLHMRQGIRNKCNISKCVIGGLSIYMHIPRINWHGLYCVLLLDRIIALSINHARMCTVIYSYDSVQLLYRTFCHSHVHNCPSICMHACTDQVINLCSDYTMTQCTCISRQLQGARQARGESMCSIHSYTEL